MTDASDEPNRARPWVALAALLAIVGTIAYYASRSGDTTVDTERSSSGPVEIRYELSGTASGADITYETPSGTGQQQDVAVPLKTKAGGSGMVLQFDPGAFVYISAQNTGDGSITCRIVGSDGTKIAETTSRGEYAIASCDGTAR